MIAVGNDIVDLTKVNNNPQYISRLLNYAFNQEEANLVTTDLTKTWTYWSAKESAYKSSVKRGNRQRFRPKDFLVSDTGQNILRVITPEYGHFELSSQITEKYVYTVSQYFNSSIQSRIFKTHFSQQSDISLKLKDKLITEICNLAGESKGETRIEKDEFLIPHVMVGNQKLDYDISLSHDGNFMAFAYSL